MSQRYEMIRAQDDRPVHVAPGSIIGLDTLGRNEHALILGDPEATALVVVARHGDLRAYAERILAALDAEPESWNDDDCTCERDESNPCPVHDA